MTGSGALHRAGVPGVHDFLFLVPWPWTDATYEAVTLTEWGVGGEAGVTADLCTLAKNTFKCSTKSAPHFSDGEYWGASPCSFSLCCRTSPSLEPL